MLNPYQRYIALSRYARFLPEQNRRETWEETVNRYCDYFAGKYPDKFPRDQIFNAISSLAVMPSMRALMTAGKALDRDNVAGYNCSYIAVDDPRAFDEALYVLMCGTGLGFSVERQFIAKLPEVSETFFNTDTLIKVRDSKLGWASSYRELINLLYAGRIPKWDLSALRPAGAPLKTFGGRSSGPAPLDDLFVFTINTFKKAAGRRLSSLECHDIMCKIADVVVVGGVRRSALISLSNLSDDRLRNAKTGQWWVDFPHRALSNNSAAYTEKPEIGHFLREWLSLYESKSGERGIVNRLASKKKVKSLERRKSDWDFGTNPCVTGDTVVMTKQGPKTVDQLIDTAFELVQNNEVYSSKGFWKTGRKPVYKVKTSHGYEIKATADHRFAVADEREWIELQDLVPEDQLIISNSRRDIDINPTEADLGWILGEVVGDGCYNPSKNYHGLVRFWGETAESMSEQAFSIVEAIDTNYNQPRKPSHAYQVGDNIFEVKSKKISDLCAAYLNDDKTPNVNLETSSLSMISGFISGMFDSDGTIGGNTKKQGIFLQLSQSNRDTLVAIQRMLINFGIVSRIHHVKSAGPAMMPNGRGEDAEYECKDQYRLDIGRDNVELFEQYIGFRDPDKKAKLRSLIESKTRTSYKTSFVTEVVSVEYAGLEDVYDCTVDQLHAFPANGIIVHNCGEIVLRPQEFCNLTEVVIREGDTLETLRNKVEIATILGTFQSTLTDFRYLRSIWKKNVEEERLLGVSLTGIMDHPVLGYVSDQAKEWLTQLREHSVATNKKWAEMLGVNQSAAITTVKPSGTVSQLVDSSSGIHPRMSRYYIRTVRNDKKDPLSDFLIEQGVPHETDVMKDSNWVFSFPMKSPASCRIASEMSAIDQLEHYMMVNRYWAEHNPSITVYVREHEWIEVGAWVYKHFDDINGVSFLPYNDSIYQQAPYQPIEKEKYLELMQKFPDVNFDNFNVDEYEDKTTGTQTLACVAGNCEI